MDLTGDIQALDRENQFRSDLRTLRSLVGVPGQRQAGSIAAYVLDLQQVIESLRAELQRKEEDLARAFSVGGFAKDAIALAKNAAMPVTGMVKVLEGTIKRMHDALHDAAREYRETLHELTEARQENERLKALEGRALVCLYCYEIFGAPEPLRDHRCEANPLVRENERLKAEKHQHMCRTSQEKMIVTDGFEHTHNGGPCSVCGDAG